MSDLTLRFDGATGPSLALRPELVERAATWLVEHGTFVAGREGDTLRLGVAARLPDVLQSVRALAAAHGWSLVEPTLDEALAAMSWPTYYTPQGSCRVGKTRVSIDSVVWAYRRTPTVEGVIEQYDALSVEDATGALHFYLAHRAAVDAEVDERRAESERARQESIARGDNAKLVCRIREFRLAKIAERRARRRGVTLATPAV